MGIKLDKDFVNDVLLKEVNVLQNRYHLSFDVNDGLSESSKEIYTNMFNRFLLIKAVFSLADENKIKLEREGRAKLSHFMESIEDFLLTKNACIIDEAAIVM